MKTVVKIVALIAVVGLTGCAGNTENSKWQYDTRQIQGWTVKVDKRLLGLEYKYKSETTERNLMIIDEQLANIIKVIPAKIVKNYAKSKYMLHRYPMVILHEFTHAYQSKVLGWDNWRIRSAYQRAMKTGLYRNSYAATSLGEFFTDVSIAYFGNATNYPYNRERRERRSQDSRVDSQTMESELNFSNNFRRK